PARLVDRSRRALLGGLDAIRADRALRRLTILAVSLAAVFPVFTLALPLIARSSGAGGLGYGALSSGLVTGMAVGGFAAAPLTARMSGDRAVALGLGAASAATLVLAWSPDYPVTLAGALALGVAVG